MAFKKLLTLRLHLMFLVFLPALANETVCQATEFIVRGTSMEPALKAGDSLVLDTSLSTPIKICDLVVFTTPKNRRAAVVKQVVAVPGDFIQISDSGVLLVNGDSAIAPNGAEYYVPKKQRKFVMMYGSPIRGLWVLGKQGSLDSTQIGPIPHQNLLGRVRKVNGNRVVKSCSDTSR